VVVDFHIDDQRRCGDRRPPRGRVWKQSPTVCWAPSRRSELQRMGITV